MDEKEIFLTAEGLKKLELELEELKTVKNWRKRRQKVYCSKRF